MLELRDRAGRLLRSVEADNLEGVDLSGAWLPSLRCDGVMAYRARLAGSFLAEAHLPKACLREADLTGAVLCGADLEGTDLRWTSLVGAQLRLANLTAADLRFADLRGAWLVGATLPGARLEGASLHGAWYSTHTVWPATFEPLAHPTLVQVPAGDSRREQPRWVPQLAG